MDILARFVIEEGPRTKPSEERTPEGNDAQRKGLEYVLNLLMKVLHSAEELRNKLNREPTPEEISREVGLSVDRIRIFLATVTVDAAASASESRWDVIDDEVEVVTLPQDRGSVFARPSNDNSVELPFGGPTDDRAVVELYAQDLEERMPQTAVNEDFVRLIMAIQSGKNVPFSSLIECLKNSKSALVDLTPYAPSELGKSVYFDKEGLIHELKNKELAGPSDWVILMFDLAYGVAEAQWRNEDSLLRMSVRCLPKGTSSYEENLYKIDRLSRNELTVQYQTSQPVL